MIKICNYNTNYYTIKIDNDDGRLKPHFDAQNFYGHVKKFLWKLSRIWVRALQTVRQLCHRSTFITIAEISVFHDSKQHNRTENFIFYQKCLT
jgi:hypothetical protein